MTIRYGFRAKLWRYPGESAWHFVTLPKRLSKQIRTLSFGLRNPFGSLRVIASVGETRWRTSAFWDTKAGAFLLPVKSDVRRCESIAVGDTFSVSLELDV